MDAIRFREVSEETENMYQTLYKDICACFVKVRDGEDILAKYTEASTRLSGYYNMDIFVCDQISDLTLDRLEKLYSLEALVKDIDEKYAEIVKDEYGGEESPLANIPLPGKEIFITIYAHYFCRLTTLPRDFTYYLQQIQRSDTADGARQLPFDMQSIGKTWVDPVLFSRGWNMRPYRIQYNMVKEFDEVVDILKDERVQKHVAYNIIGSRFYVRKWRFNDELQEDINALIEKRDKVLLMINDLKTRWNKFDPDPRKNQDIQKRIKQCIENSSFGQDIFFKLGKELYDHIQGLETLNVTNTLYWGEWYHIILKYIKRKVLNE